MKHFGMYSYEHAILEIFQSNIYVFCKCKSTLAHIVLSMQS